MEKVAYKASQTDPCVWVSTIIPVLRGFCTLWVWTPVPLLASCVTGQQVSTLVSYKTIV